MPAAKLAHPLTADPLTIGWIAKKAGHGRVDGAIGRYGAVAQAARTTGCNLLPGLDVAAPCVALTGGPGCANP